MKQINSKNIGVEVKLLLFEYATVCLLPILSKAPSTWSPRSEPDLCDRGHRRQRRSDVSTRRRVTSRLPWWGQRASCRPGRSHSRASRVRGGHRLSSDFSKILGSRSWSVFPDPTPIWFAAERDEERRELTRAWIQCTECARVSSWGWPRYGGCGELLLTAASLSARSSAVVSFVGESSFRNRSGDAIKSGLK